MKKTKVHERVVVVSLIRAVTRNHPPPPHHHLIEMKAKVIPRESHRQ